MRAETAYASDGGHVPAIQNEATTTPEEARATPTPSPPSTPTTATTTTSSESKPDIDNAHACNNDPISTNQAPNGHVDRRRTLPGRHVSVASEYERPRAPDGGWGWVVLAAAFLNYMVLSAIWFSFVVLYQEYADHFQQPLAKVGMLASLETASMHFTGAFCPGMVERYGPRPVALVGSLVAGVTLFAGAFCDTLWQLCVVYTVAGAGIGLSFVSFTVTVQQYFHKKRAIASGISLTGFSLATFSLPPFTRWLHDLYGWRGTLIIIGGVYLNGMVLACFLRPLPTIYRDAQRRMSSVSAPSRKMSLSRSLARQVSVQRTRTRLHKCTQLFRKVFDYTMFQRPVFVLYGVGTLFAMLGNIAFVMHMVNRAQFYGIEKHMAMFLPSIYGVVNGVSRLTFSFMANMSCSDRTLMYGLWIIFGGFVSCAGCVARSFTGFAVVSAAFGMSVGSFLCVQYPALVDLLGVDKIAKSTGLLQIFIGTAGLVATPLPGWIFDVTHNYDLPYIVTGSIMIVGGFIVVSIPCISRYNNRFNPQPTGDGKAKGARPRSLSAIDSRARMTDPDLSRNFLDGEEVVDELADSVFEDSEDYDVDSKTCHGRLRTFSQSSHISARV